MNTCPGRDCSSEASTQEPHGLAQRAEKGPHTVLRSHVLTGACHEQTDRQVSSEQSQLSTAEHSRFLGSPHWGQTSQLVVARRRRTTVVMAGSTKADRQWERLWVFAQTTHTGDPQGQCPLILKKTDYKLFPQFSE